MYGSPMDGLVVSTISKGTVCQHRRIQELRLICAFLPYMYIMHPQFILVSKLSVQFQKKLMPT